MSDACLGLGTVGFHSNVDWSYYIGSQVYGEPVLLIFSLKVSFINKNMLNDLGSCQITTSRRSDWE